MYLRIFCIVFRYGLSPPARSVQDRRQQTGSAQAQAGQPKSAGTAKEANGTLDIPVGIGLSYKYADATASAGQVTITSKNPQPTDHNISTACTSTYCPT